MIFYSTSETQTEEIAEKSIAPKLKSGDVIALYGTLGMGKTAFVRGLAKGLGIKDDVQSPTFSIIHEYRGNPPLAHFDMYRVSTWDDLEQTGFFDYIENGAIVVTEWSENIENALPKNHIKIEISNDNSNCEESADNRIINVSNLD